MDDQERFAAAMAEAKETPGREVKVTSAADIAAKLKQAAEHQRKADRILADLAKAEARLAAAKAEQ